MKRCYARQTTRQHASLCRLRIIMWRVTHNKTACVYFGGRCRVGSRYRNSDDGKDVNVEDKRQSCRIDDIPGCMFCEWNSISFVILPDGDIYILMLLSRMTM